jgi:hypothetical protein
MTLAAVDGHRQPIATERRWFADYLAVDAD